MTASPELVKAAVHELEAALREARVELPASARFAERSLAAGLHGRGSTWDGSGAPQLLRTEEGVRLFARYRVVDEATEGADELSQSALLQLGVTANAGDTLLLLPSRFGDLQPSVLRDAIFSGLQSIEDDGALSDALGRAFLAAVLELRPPNGVLAGAIQHVPGLGRLVLRRLRAHLFRFEDSRDVDADFLHVVAEWLATHSREPKTQLVSDLTPGDLNSFEAAKRASKPHPGPSHLSLPQARAWYEVARPAGALLWTLVPTQGTRAAWSLARSSLENTGMVPILVPLHAMPMALGVGEYEFAPGAAEAIAGVSRESSDGRAAARGEPPPPGDPVAWPSLEERFEAHRVLALVLVNETEGWKAVATLRDPQAWPGVAMLARLRILEQRYGIVPMALDPYALAALQRPRPLTRAEAWDALHDLRFAHAAGSWFDERNGGVESLMRHDVWWLDLGD